MPLNQAALDKIASQSPSLLEGSFKSSYDNEKASQMQKLKDFLTQKRVEANLGLAKQAAKDQNMKPGTYSLDVGDNQVSVKPQSPLIGLENFLTPGQKAADTAFGKDYADFQAGGGKTKVESDINRIQGIPQRLANTDAATGPIIGALPKFARDIVSPESGAIQDDLELSIQNTLKQILGGQYTEREAHDLFARTYNPRLSEAENATRVNRLQTQLQGMLNDKDNSAKYFQSHGTLKGYTPRGLGASSSPSQPAVKHPEQMSDEELRRELGQ